MAGNANSIYAAKKAASQANPVTSLKTFLQSDNSAKAAAVYVPDQWQMGTVAGSFKFALRAWGRVTSGTSGNVSFSVDFGTSTTQSSNTAIIAPSAAAYSVSGNWNIDAELVWDSTSKLLNGIYTGWVTSAGTTIASTTITQLSAKDFTTNGLGFTVSSFFGTSNAGNVVFLDGLTLEER